MLDAILNLPQTLGVGWLTNGIASVISAAFAFTRASLPVLQVLFLLSLVAYVVLNSLVPTIFTQILGPQDLKKKYDAKWALVTGGSSGIGKQIAIQLMKQGLNVVIVAQNDKVFDATMKEFESTYGDLLKDLDGGRLMIAKSCAGYMRTPNLMRRVNANLADGTGAWMADVKAATDDINIQVVFNNAGFIVPGFFEQNTLEEQLANFHCNLTANVHLTHHFYEKMVSKRLRGCIVYTSSPAGCIPNPLAAIYGCSKAGLSELAASLAVEGKPHGIDVHAVHPSPVNSRFLLGGGNKVTMKQVVAMDMAYKLASDPDHLPLKIFAAIGRAPALIDLGCMSIGIRLLVHIFGSNLLTLVFTVLAPLSPDFKNKVVSKHKEEPKEEKKDEKKA